MNASTLQDAAETIGKVAERFDAMARRRRTDSAAGNYAAQLKSAWEDSERFDLIVAKLRGDRSIKTEDMSEIAKECVGHEPRNKGREAALQEIVKWQMLDARRNARGARI